MKILIILLMLFSSNGYTNAQTYFTRNGYIGFFSKTPLEDIKAENNQVYAIIDITKKNLAFTCLVKGFLFRKQLMQQHFNENYVESDKYPKASFSGSYTGNVVGHKDGKYDVQVSGNLTLHGVTQQINAPATIEVSGSNLAGNCRLKLIPGDFNIEIPGLVKDKIAKEIDVVITVNCNPK